MNDFGKVFRDYGGNYEETMPRFMGNEAVYLRILDMLFKDENLRKLGDAIDAGDLAAGFEAAHALKGVTGNLGLAPLYAAVCDIVEPLRHEQQGMDYLRMYQEIEAEFRKVETLRDALKATQE